MNHTVRAKFRCTSESRTNQFNLDQREYEFTAVYDDGIPENTRYAKYTPTGSLKITVDNPSVRYELGKSYYLDFTEAPD